MVIPSSSNNIWITVFTPSPNFDRHSSLSRPPIACPSIVLLIISFIVWGGAPFYIPRDISPAYIWVIRGRMCAFHHPAMRRRKAQKADTRPLQLNTASRENFNFPIGGAVSHFHAPHLKRSTDGAEEFLGVDVHLCENRRREGRLEVGVHHDI